jgi:anaerobic selenocysteine-containing dehydrogenase
VRNVAKYSAPIIPAGPSERLDWEIVTELAGRLFVPRPLRPLQALALAGARWLSPERLVDVLLRIGPHKLSLARLRRSPHGMDLGGLEPGRFLDRIATPDRMADIAPADFLREARAELSVEAGRDPDGELVIVGRRQLRDNNSWMHNAPRLIKGPERCTLLVHPADAAPRRLASGDFARLGSNTGEVVVAVEVTEAMRPGVVSLPHGWGHNRHGTRQSVASQHSGASMNDLTDDAHVDTLSGNAAFNGLAVTLERADGRNE